MMRTPLLLATENACDRSTLALLNAGAAIDATDRNEQTALHWLAHHGSTDLIATAVGQGAKMAMEASNAAGETPLSRAISRGHYESAKLLLDNGALPTCRDSSGVTALQLAVKYGAQGGDASKACRILQLLLGIASNVDEVDAEKRTALHFAVVDDALLSGVNALLNAGASVNIADWAGHTPLHWACYFDAVAISNSLLDHGASASARDRHQRTPLHSAAERNSLRCLELLIQNSSLSVDVVDVDGFSPLHYAARASAIECVKLLLEAGADRRIESLSGAIPADLTTAPDIHELLRDPGLKRQRTTSISNLNLPDIVSALYVALNSGAKEQLDPFITPRMKKAAQDRLLKLLGGPPITGQMHVSNRTKSVFVEILPSKFHIFSFDDESVSLVDFRTFEET